MPFEILANIINFVKQLNQIKFYDKINIKIVYLT